MDGTFVGLVSMSGSGALTFTYDEDYRSAPGATPMSLSMPRTVARHRQRAVLPFLQGLLPDNTLALDSLAATFQVSPSSPFALLEHVGGDVAGALQLVRPGETSTDAAADRSASSTLSETELAADLASVIEVYRTGRPRRGWDRMRISLAGAQPKIALNADRDGSWRRPAPGAPSTHILKAEYVTPRTAEDRRLHDLNVVEAFSLAVARGVGVRTPPARVWVSPDGDLRALVLERYDRVGSGGSVRRVHQEDLCQALSVPPSKKYQHRDGGPGVGALGELLKARLSRQDRQPVARDFLMLLTLNIAMVNTDAHAKNYSFLLEGDRVSLAPAYDVLSFAPFETFDSDLEPVSFPMRIGETYRIGGMTAGMITREGARLGLALDEARAIVESVLARLPGALEAARAEVVAQSLDHGVIDATLMNLRRLSPLHGDPSTIVDLGSLPQAPQQGGR